MLLLQNMRPLSEHSYWAFKEALNVPNRWNDELGLRGVFGIGSMIEVRRFKTTQRQS